MKDITPSQYEIEAIVSFDDRGQLVIPKELRKKFNLKAGDKFALISCVPEDAGCCGTETKTDCCSTSEPNQVCCFTLINTNQLKGLISNFMAPAMSGLAR